MNTNTKEKIKSALSTCIIGIPLTASLFYGMLTQHKGLTRLGLAYVWLMVITCISYGSKEVIKKDGDKEPQCFLINRYYGYIMRFAVNAFLVYQGWIITAIYLFIANCVFAHYISEVDKIRKQQKKDAQ